MNSPIAQMPAEWQYECDILMAWPHEQTDWADMLAEVRDCYRRLIEAFTSEGLRVILLSPSAATPAELAHINPGQLIVVEYLTNDTWTRDYGPVTVTNPDGTLTPLNFCFNGWGLKFAANRDNLATPFLAQSGIITTPRNESSFVAEGGGLESDGQGTLLTTALCQLSPNRNGCLTETQIIEALKQKLGCERVLMLHHGYLAGDDTDSHIDTLARFAPGNTIIFTGCYDPSDEHFAELQAMKEEITALRTPEGLPYNLIELPLPNAIYDEDGQRLPATYANFLVTPHALFMPTYGQKQNDLLAHQMLMVAFDMPVIDIDCRSLIYQHGSLHCATMQLPTEIVRI